MAPSLKFLHVASILLWHLHAVLLCKLLLFVVESPRVEAIRLHLGHRLSPVQLRAALTAHERSHIASGSIRHRKEPEWTPDPLASGYLPDGVTRDVLISWAQDPKQKGMPPGMRVEMEQCGYMPEAKIAVPRRVRTYEEAAQVYQSQVRSHQEARKSLHNTMQNSDTFSAVRLLFLQWNTELFTPTPWEILQAVIPANGAKPDVNTIDVFFITVQECLRMQGSQYRRLIENLVLGLNALSQRPTWSVESSSYTQLQNTIGTKFPKLGPWANTQAIILVGREHIDPGSIGHCEWSWRSRQKGFVGISATIGSEENKVLVLGTHMVTAKEDQSQFLQQTLEQAVQRCVPSTQRELGLDYFGAGTYLVGDMNSRFSERETQILMDDVATRPLFSEMKTVVPEADQSVEQARLLNMLGAPIRAKEMKYFPILYALDTLGGSLPDKGENELGTSLLFFGFDVISVCYTGLVSYKWTKGCQVQPGESQRDVDEHCLDTASKQSAAQTGFLDRLIIRRPVGSTACKDWRCASSKVEPFLVLSGQLLNFRGDHLPQLYLVEACRQGSTLKREVSAPALLIEADRSFH